MAESEAHIVRTLYFPNQHVRLTQFVPQDQTDSHNERVQVRFWLLHPSEAEINLQGNLFVIEDPIAAADQPGYYGAVEAGPLFVENR